MRGSEDPRTCRARVAANAPKVGERSAANPPAVLPLRPRKIRVTGPTRGRAAHATGQPLRATSPLKGPLTYAFTAVGRFVQQVVFLEIR